MLLKVSLTHIKVKLLVKAGNKFKNLMTLLKLRNEWNWDKLLLKEKRLIFKQTGEAA